MPIELMMPSNYLILCHPLLLLPSIFPSIRVFFSELNLRIRWPKYWSFSFSISPSNEYSGLISLGLTGLISLQSKGLSRVFSNATVWKHQFFDAQPSLWSNSHIHWGFPCGSVGKESTCNAGDPGLIPGSGRSPGEGIGYPLRHSWASLVAQLVKNLPAMWETWVWSLGWEDPLEKGKAMHSSILAGRIPWGCKKLDMAEQLSVWCFPCGSAGKESACNLGNLGWEDPLEGIQQG